MSIDKIIDKITVDESTLMDYADYELFSQRVQHSGVAYRGAHKMSVDGQWGRDSQTARFKYIRVIIPNLEVMGVMSTGFTAVIRRLSEGGIDLSKPFTERHYRNEWVCEQVIQLDDLEGNFMRKDATGSTSKSSTIRHIRALGHEPCE